MTEHLLLIDCSAFAYRSYYSQPAMRRQDSGEPTGAVLGYMSLIWRMLGAVQADPPTLAAAVFDAPGKNFRHKLFPAYKANRPADRALNLEKQLPLMRPVSEVLGLTPVELKGFEADDIIATLATRAHKAGIRTTIVSSDKDFGQLVVDGWIEIVDPMARARDPDKSPRRLEADILRKFGVRPPLVPEVQALAGDSVDGIPGIPKVGLDTAARLINQFGSLEGVLAHANEAPSPVVRAALAKHGKDARLYLKLTTLRRDVPVKVKFEDLAIRPIKGAELNMVVRALDPNARVQELFGLDLQDVRLVERIEDPLEWYREELAAKGQQLPLIPQCGFYQTRLVHGGAFVPARIWREPHIDPVTGKDSGFDLLRCEVNGKPRDPMAMFTRLAMNPIRANDFEYEKADMAHAKAFRPNDPKASPHKRIDILKIPAQHSQTKAERKVK